ncbi:tyrosine-type recombinase/integrase [Microbacterium sp. YJN-G]|uniref:tyrosine-type recombinase/integrase n=1 Tax=Microbacterium sp. YJN-G TaxID=2763257 RepID=UPI00187849E1|nr:tyrosine-type recombinase/integrase [Microbacterium sp. YJN-G]
MSVETRKTSAGKTRYLARVKVGNVQVATKTFHRKSEAEAWEREQKHLLTTGRPLPPTKSISLGELVAMFQRARASGNPHTIDTDNHNLAALSKRLLVRPVSSIQAEDVREHLLAELQSGKAPATVARARTTLSALFTYAAEHDLLRQPHPVRTMKKIPELGTAAQRTLSLSEIPTPQQVTSTLALLRERRSDIADVFEFMSLTGIRWGEARAARVSWLSEHGLTQLNVRRSHSDGYAEKNPKSWRGTRSIPLSPRAVEIFHAHAAGRSTSSYVFTNQLGGQLSANLVRKFPLGFRRHALRHFAASTWLRLGTPINEVAEYLGDEARTVLTTYAHVLGEGQRRDFVDRLAAAESKSQNRVHSTYTWGPESAPPSGPSDRPEFGI